MPIKPPRLDDRNYDDLVSEARALIPQYCPEWTHLGDADPGMTLVQLFAWMTEMTLYRLNRVPDKTYVHFLNFIGEERRPAQPARAPVTFSQRAVGDRAIEVKANTRCSTRQRHGGDALHFLTEAPVSVHGAQITRMVAVAAGSDPLVREIPFQSDDDHPHALKLGSGNGVQIFQLDPIADGPYSYTAEQFVYLRHEDFTRMTGGEEDREGGMLRIRSGGRVPLPIAALFHWTYPSADDGWRDVRLAAEVGELRDLPEVYLEAALPGMCDMERLGTEAHPIAWPEDLPQDGWIRGQVRFERWLARLMDEDRSLTITWCDDRGSLEREITNWYVRDVGRTLEFQIHNLPPIRGGWRLRLTMADTGMATGRDAYFPRYRWSYRRGERWVQIRDDRVECHGAAWVITGPLVDMAVDGVNLRAERVETIDLDRIVPEMKADLMWRRPIRVALASGPEDTAAVPMVTTALPTEPFQTMPSLPALLGMKFYMGSNLLANRVRRPVLLELEIGFERDGELVEEPVDDYHLRLDYRSELDWQTVHHDELNLARFTFSDIDPDGAQKPQRRLLRLLIDPRTQLRGLIRSKLAGTDTAWLRLELTRAALSYQPDPKVPPVPVSLRIYAVRMSLGDAPGARMFDEPLPGIQALSVEHRISNPRLTRTRRRKDGRVVEELPFDRVIDIEDDAPGGHHAMYMQLDRPLPVGRRFATMFQCRGEAFVPRGYSVQWELLQRAGSHGRRWTRLATRRDDGDEGYGLDGTGVLEFGIDKPMEPAADGVWIRGIVRCASGPMPALPPMTHVLLNTVEARNLHGFRMEKFSGLGVPHQELQLRHFPIYLPSTTAVDGERATALRVIVEESDGEFHSWRVAAGNTLSGADKDDRVFTVDVVEGTLTFGNGIRGRILPVGSFNVVVESYHTVPGAVGNVASEEICIAEGYGDVVEVVNHLPAHGGRSAESIDEIVRRAPSILTSRDRAVTRQDFEIIAEEASAEVARAACNGSIGPDGAVEIVILPQRREDEVLPDPFLAAGLKEHVSRYLAQRCLVNVRPVVRLARFLHVDVSISVRLRSHANAVAARENVRRWVRTFLDPYTGGLNGEGWPFGAAVYAQDFGRLVADVPEVRHVVDVGLYDVVRPEENPGSGWSEARQSLQVLSLHEADLLHVRELRVVRAKERG